MSVEEDAGLALLTCDPLTWHNASLLSVTQLTPGGLELLLARSKEMRTLVRTRGGDERLKHRVLGTVFLEASTRTSCSFQAAMLRLGGTFVHVDSTTSSAAKKGESIDDTLACIESYSDILALRHSQKNAIRGRRRRPLVNAGDGTGEHPTQALLDVFTIYDELDVSSIQETFIVVLLGDLKHGRTVHSLAKLLARCCSQTRQITLRYCSPDLLPMPQDVQNYVSQFTNVIQQEGMTLLEAIQGAHVLYVTRVQKERFETLSEYEAVKGAYRVDVPLMKEAPSNMILLHPLPRVDEIATEVDTDPRAAYIRQMENGMFVRMAILALLLGKAS